MKNTQDSHSPLETKPSSGLTIGLDLGERRNTFCVLDPSGEVRKEGSVSNERSALSRWLTQWPSGSVIIMEAGTHSPWISRLCCESGFEVFVANPRKVRAIYQNERKSDQRDALMLARIGRADPALLYPIEHGSAQAQQDSIVIKQRDSLVRARVALISSMRSTLKSLGYKISNPSSERFHKLVLHEAPADIHPVLAPTVAALTAISLQIKELDATIKRLSSERYPETQYLQQISGVGPITSLAFVLKIECPERFARTRDVGAYLGLCPRRDQSGDSDKQLPITKAGDRYLRRLLVSAAQYILGPFGRESALRNFGLQLASAGNARAKKRAVIAVARKLSILMLSLWKTQVAYEPFPQAA